MIQQSTGMCRFKKLVNVMHIWSILSGDFFGGGGGGGGGEVYV